MVNGVLRPKQLGIILFLLLSITVLGGVFWYIKYVRPAYNSSFFHLTNQNPHYTVVFQTPALLQTVTNQFQPLLAAQGITKVQLIFPATNVDHTSKISWRDTAGKSIPFASYASTRQASQLQIELFVNYPTVTEYHWQSGQIGETLDLLLIEALQQQTTTDKTLNIEQAAIEFKQKYPGQGLLWARITNP